ncbi:unnamed protein product [Caenorhabditis bovis]|uniref:Uncharacterized protein n=1 Tax=Caenorhabditis bovis TaxID=2654633 RepID=A0A8S1EW72_9PELO|nr:unnamed protein product [Caenorhabditis bovis]
MNVITMTCYNQYSQQLAHELMKSGVFQNSRAVPFEAVKLVPGLILTFVKAYHYYLSEVVGVLRIVLDPLTFSDEPKQLEDAPLSSICRIC